MLNSASTDTSQLERKSPLIHYIHAMAARCGRRSTRNLSEGPAAGHLANGTDTPPGRRKTTLGTFCPHTARLRDIIVTIHSRSQSVVDLGSLQPSKLQLLIGECQLRDRLLFMVRERLLRKL
ncbi:hypothetical protein ID866_603 [Astraeus odoratus]|nr:hypothetical protein ID866_603 [Astraeus odoratus]